MHRMDLMHPPAGLYPDTDPRPSWEIRDRIGLFSAFFQTTKEVYFNASETFWGMPQDRGYGGPLLYAILSSLMSVTAWYGTLILLSIVTEYGRTYSFAVIFSKLVTGMTEVYLLLIFIPFIIIAAISLYAVCIHLMMCFQFESECYFQATFRTVCYTTGTSLQIGMLYWVVLAILMHIVVFIFTLTDPILRLYYLSLIFLSGPVGVMTIRLNGAALSVVHDIPYTTAQVSSAIPVVVFLTLGLAWWAFSI